MRNPERKQEKAARIGYDPRANANAERRVRYFLLSGDNS
jgi:hypothetical protein